jgi:predicted nucleic acid-binding protein
MKGERVAPATHQEIFVLDSSVTLAWFFEDETNPYADSVDDSFVVARAVAPALWPIEVANGLLMGERRKRTTETRVSEFLRLLESLPISVDDQKGSHAWKESVHLARKHRLTVYDADYLELAMRLRKALASIDEQLIRAAIAEGVAAYQP